MTLPAPYQQLLQAFDALPGIGPRAAARLAQFVISQPEGEQLADAVRQARDGLRLCQRCFRYALQEECDSCRQPPPAPLLYVVASIDQVEPLEASGITSLFVLHGLLSPVAGTGPGQLHLPQLRTRVINESIEQLLLLLPDGVEADATACFISDLLADLPVVTERRRMTDGSGRIRAETDDGAA